MKCDFTKISVTIKTEAPALGLAPLSSRQSAKATAYSTTNALIIKASLISAVFTRLWAFHSHHLGRCMMIPSEEARAAVTSFTMLLSRGETDSRRWRDLAEVLQPMA